jgi:hypothetical protein
MQSGPHSALTVTSDAGGAPSGFGDRRAILQSGLVTPEGGIMKRTSLVFGTTILLLAALGLAQADHRVIAGSWCGDEGTGQDNAFWNDLSLNDSICRTELQVDTIINLFYDCTFYGMPVPRGQIIPNFFPKYATSFVDDTASLAKLDSVTSFWANTLDSTDILYFIVESHGGWEYGHSVVLDYEDRSLTDSIMAADFNRIPAYKLFVFNPCMTWGNGRHPDSCGFATWLGYNAPESISHKTIILSGAGPQPAWSTMPCDDRVYSGGPQIESLENEQYNGSRYEHGEFSFHIFTGLNGGAEPSEYYSDSAPGFFIDSIDTNHDSQISVAEAFIWDRHRNSQLGFENNQMLDLGNLADTLVIWPRIGWLESTGIEEPQVILPENPPSLPYPTAMSCASFCGWLARHSDLRVYDMSGRQVQPNQVRPGVYFWRIKIGPTHKVVLTG